MSGRDLLERIKARIDIVDVLSDYIQLKKTGANYKGLCPFHNEKTPSFIVSPDKQVFHCFGCGAGGDVVGFVMKHESMSFPEAMKFLAIKAGLPPEEYESGEFRKFSEEKASLKALLKDASEFYSETLNTNKKAREYLKKRAITEEGIKKFSLGYAPKSWNALLTRLKEKGHPEGLILKSGVAQSGQKGAYDMLRERIIFPIRDVQGSVIAFGGRVLDDSLPKYLNSPDTILFKKGETLYGLDLAKEGIRKKGYLVLTEGYLDVIMCHQEGFENVIAPLGTALTQAHLARISRFTKKLVLLFDGDQAGIAAAKRSLGIALEQEFIVKVVLLPEGEDPDSVLRSRGAGEFRKYLGRAYTPMEFILRGTKGPRVDILREAIALISRVKEPIMQEELIRELSETGKVREEAIRKELRKQSAPHGSGREEKNAQKKGACFVHNEESLLLSVFVNMPEMRKEILGLLSLDELTEPAVKGLFLKLKDSETLSEEERGLMAKVSIEPGFSPPEASKAVEDCVRRIRIRRIEQRIKEGAKNGDINLLKSLYEEKKNLKGGRAG